MALNSNRYEHDSDYRRVVDNLLAAADAHSNVVRSTLRYRGQSNQRSNINLLTAAHEFSRVAGGDDGVPSVRVA